MLYYKFYSLQGGRGKGFAEKKRNFYKQLIGLVCWILLDCHAAEFFIFKTWGKS